MRTDRTMEESLMEKNSRARGALFDLYTNSNDKSLLQLRDTGYCVIRNALPADVVQSFVDRVDANLEEDGFEARFGKPMGRPMMAKDLPSTTFWSIDTILYPLTAWAIELRFAIRDAFARVAGVDPTSLASSFDGVVMKDGKYVGPLQRPISQHEIKNHIIPCTVNKKTGLPGGPTHCDQSRYRRKSCESLQIFCPLNVGDLSTILLSPTEGWTLQGILDELTNKFPSYYKPQASPVGGKRKRVNGDGDLHEEGYSFPAEHRDHILSIGAVKMVKPELNPGDLLIWSSAIPHCNGQYVSALKPTERAPRLGIITAFAPKSLMSDAAREIFARVVGAGYATGQQILYPSKHGSSEARVWRFSKPEDVPKVYHEHREWRKSLSKRPLWISNEEDTHETAEMRSKLRCLLGM